MENNADAAIAAQHPQTTQAAMKESGDSAYEVSIPSEVTGPLEVPKNSPPEFRGGRLS